MKQIDYLSYAGASFKWIFAALAISIVILIVSYKFNLFKRNNKIPNFLAKLYYFIIPVYFVVFAFQFAQIFNTQKQILTLIDANKPTLVLFASTFLDQFIGENSESDKGSMSKIIDKYVLEYVNSKSWEAKKSENKFISDLVTKVENKIEYEFLKRVVESKIIAKLSTTAGFEENTVEQIYKSDVSTLFREGEIIEIFKGKVKEVFKGFYQPILLMFLGGLFIILVEIILAKKVLRY